MARFAKGTFAWAVCDSCGLRGRYRDMVIERDTRMVKHRECCDDPYPFWGFLREPDPVALRHPRPDRKEPSIESGEP